MAADVITEPASPASVYRPMQFVLDRDDQTGAQVIEIRIADAADVVALGAGLAVGDVLIEHAAPLDGTPVPIAVGQTVLIRDCGSYSGVRTVTKVIDQDGTPSDFMVIEAPDYGTVTPASGGVRVWLDRYAIVVELSVYTNPATDPQIVLLRGTPKNDGSITIDVGKPIRDYFTHEIQPFSLLIPGATIVQNAHGLTALFYRVRIAEVFASPGNDYATYPAMFEGAAGTSLLLDDFNDEGAPVYRMAVNAVHAYHRADSNGTAMLSWTATDLSDYIIGGSSQKALTYAPRSLKMADSDMFRLHFLNLVQDPPDEYKVNRGLKINTVNADGSETALTTVAFDLGSTVTSSFSVGVGPADLTAAGVTVPAKYSVQVVAGDLTHLDSEKFIIEVDATCKEVRRPICVLNLLGGVDHYSFTGREIVETKNGVQAVTISTAPVDKDVRLWLVENLCGRGKVATLQKPYSAGSGFDWTERVYKGPNAVLRVAADRVAPIIVESDETSRNSGPMLRPVTVQFRLGVDQLSQQS